VKKSPSRALEERLDEQRRADKSAARDLEDRAVPVRFRLSAAFSLRYSARDEAGLLVYRVFFDETDLPVLSGFRVLFDGSIGLSSDEVRFVDFAPPGAEEADLRERAIELVKKAFPGRRISFAAKF
jgi:hypothetical protein